MRRTASLVLAFALAMVGAVILLGAAAVQDAGTQGAPTTHQIFISVIEPKGSTVTGRLAPPPIDPTTLSKGYGYKGPGEADKADPQRWEVASYNFLPAFVVAQQGDTLVLTVFVVNGDHHDVGVVGPDGRVVVPRATWDRGREYRVSFVADKPGPYKLTCFTHTPSMIATVFVLPR